MKNIFIGVGTNLGDRKENIENAYLEIESRVGKIEAKSGFYKTPPWGYHSTQDFFNTVVRISSELEVIHLLDKLKEIERDLGRNEKQADNGYEDRLIDLDIIDFNGLVLTSEKLILPHEKMHLRSFVLIPLAEIAPNWVHPTQQTSIKSLIDQNLKDAVIERIF